MDNILTRIIATKAAEVAAAKATQPLAELQDKCKDLASTRSLKASLLSHAEGGIIAEFKRRSPSKDWIKREAKVEDIIPAYEWAGAAGRSILTDSTYFGGSLDDVRTARPLTTLPILRKEFVIDAYQLYEARVAGADACLLIAAAIGVERCHELAAVAHEIGLEVILEVHSHDELAAYCPDVDIIGVNNRNLKLFKTDTQLSADLYRSLPLDAVPISESGLLQATTARQLHDIGYKGFLVGEAFMKTTQPGETLHNYINTLKA